MKNTLSNAVLAELPQRLYDSAEAFYYAAILTCLKFDASNIHVRFYGNATDAANEALAGPNRNNDLGAPTIANFCLAIELYIKLLGTLAGRPLKNGHNLEELFCELDEVAPGIGSNVIKNHHYWSDDPASFLECIKKTSGWF
jgi:hypothetical protein